MNEKKTNPEMAAYWLRLTHYLEARFPELQQTNKELE
jgi:hypothetical protein